MSPPLVFAGLKAVAYAGLALAHADPLGCFACCYTIAWLTLGEGVYHIQNDASPEGTTSFNVGTLDSQKCE